jgi:predicted ATPase/DNA-binding CsgD family transcriptional regulator
LRVAGLAACNFSDGAHLVELAPLTDPALVPASVAQALKVSERDAPTPTAALVATLADRELLVLLDNCEHVLPAAAGVVTEMLAHCPGVRILITSRERLDVPGERVFPVPPLSLPIDDSAQAIAASEAGLLFAVRASAVSATFEVSAHNAAAVAQLCSRLDGIPLAIELAAAGSAALDPAELLARLDRHPGLLSGGPARPGRHRSLEALVAWSYDLLDGAESLLLDRLSVLRGSFDLLTAESVVAGEPLRPEAIAGLLASLVNKSVVQAHSGATVRYSMLETIRQFAAERLAASGDRAGVLERLLEWALSEARSAEATLGSSRWAAWSSRLSAELDSVRAALSWALSGAQLDGGRELAARLARWWIATGQYSEANQFLTSAMGIATQAPPGIQARVLLGAAWSAHTLGDPQRSALLAAEGMTYARQANEPQLEVWGGNLLASQAWHRGDADRTVSEIASSRDPSGQTDPALAARAQLLLAMAAFLSGDLTQQEQHALQAAALARTAPGQEGLILALSVWAMPAIAGAGIQPAVVAALDEAAHLSATRPDPYQEMAMRCTRAQLFATLGQFEAAEAEAELCWAAGRRGAGQITEIFGSIADARLAAAKADTTRAIDALRRAADAGRRIGVFMFVPHALVNLACMAAIVGDDGTATTVVDEARAALDGRQQAMSEATLRCADGVLAWHRGEFAAAEQMVREATVAWHQCSDRMAACDGTELLGVLAAARERFSDAARMLAAAEAARVPLQYLAPGYTADRVAAARAASEARRAMGDDDFAKMWEQGRALTLDDAIAFATRKGGGRKRPAKGWASLTPAELGVIRLVGEGLRNDAIAQRLFIAPGTVKVHLSHIFTKLGITTRAELAASAASRGLIGRRSQASG